ncbi:unnamed protein product [Kuraishia capsulata CBS 1993]|uniref:F-box domain-containing protein n=1 Tax=Kuraishia capsulata CBS 1993 TaxID=1382522 RepID=W6MVB7_9ASCO|nr:uncharacterized protein KUCA_T00005866001 [Kuraishia capsulata CBS 1993]CDK29872.1 unnamed protein product [Kuraishia capsulata CBS 1993]
MDSISHPFEGKSAFDEIPIEIWHIICKHLEPAQKFNLSLVNRHMNSLISNDELWFEDVRSLWYIFDNSSKFSPLADWTCPSSGFYKEYARRQRQDAYIESRIERAISSGNFGDFPKEILHLGEICVPVLVRMQDHYGPSFAVEKKEGDHTRFCYPAESKRRHLERRLQSLTKIYVASQTLSMVRFRRVGGLVFEAFEKESSQWAGNITVEDMMMEICHLDPNYYELFAIRKRVLRLTVDKVKAHEESHADDTVSTASRVRLVHMILRDVIRSQCANVEGFGVPLDLVIDDHMLLRYYSGDVEGTPYCQLAAISEVCCELGMKTTFVGQSLFVRDQGSSLCSVLLTLQQLEIHEVRLEQDTPQNSSSQELSLPLTQEVTREFLHQFLERNTNNAREPGGNYDYFAEDHYLSIPPSPMPWRAQQRNVCANYHNNEKDMFPLIALYMYVSHEKKMVDREETKDLLSAVSSRSERLYPHHLQTMLSIIKDYSDLKDLSDDAKELGLTNDASLSFPFYFESFSSYTSLANYKFASGTIVLYKERELCVYLARAVDRTNSPHRLEDVLFCYSLYGELLEVRETSLSPANNISDDSIRKFAEFDEIGAYFEKFDWDKRVFVPNLIFQKFIGDRLVEMR